MGDPARLADCLPTVVLGMLGNEIARNAVQDRKRDDALWRSGYTAGYRTGHEVGYGNAHHEMAEAWSEVHKRVRSLASRRTSAEVAELLRRDVAGEPCNAKCGTCSVCIRADSVARRGGDYMGKAAHRGAA